MAKYEYFKTDQLIKGKYADYVDALWKQNSIQESCFRRLTDLYAIAAMVGLRVGLKFEEDTTSEHKRTIPLQQLISNYSVLRETMRLIILFDDSDGSSAQERIKTAFKGEPDTEEEYKKYMSLFNSYVLGGIDYIYNAIIVDPAGPDDEYAGKPGKMLSLIKGLMNYTGGI